MQRSTGASKRQRIIYDKCETKRASANVDQQQRHKKTEMEEDKTKQEKKQNIRTR